MGEILVLGAGVSGLTSAVCLLERGLRVRLWAREAPLATTSAIAAAVWFPFEAEPKERVLAWARDSLVDFRAHARDPASGVVLRSARALWEVAGPAPDWLAFLPDARALAPAELPAGFAQGFAFEVPVIEMPRYLPWLAARVRSLGADLELRNVRSLDELAGFDAVLDCTGLGARELFGDCTLFPIRGQIVRVEKNSVEQLLFFEHADGSFGYVVPRARDCVLGGTAEHGVGSLEPDDATTARILERCRALVPRRVRARLLGVAVGLRPGRTTVRLERERIRRGASGDGLEVVHNYGHGGSGVTLSWACAREAAREVESILAAAR